MKINQNHFQEWTTESAVHPEIVKLNVQSFSKHEDWSPDCKLFDFLTPNPKRTNSGRLDAGGLRKYDKCLDSSGWGVNGIDPQTWEEMDWGRFKPDPDSLLAKPYLSKKTGQLEKPPKYLSPSGVPSRAVFLRSPDWTWETIARRYNVPITPEDRLRPGGFWQWVQNNSEVPIVLEEGSKKAGCLLSLGYAAIGLPGIWMGRKYTDSITKLGEHLIPDLALFAQEGRPITILFDSDRKYATKINVYKAIIATAKLLSKAGCKVTVAILPDVEGDKNAVDDFVVAGGDIDPIIENAIDWEDYRDTCKPIPPGELNWDKWFNTIAKQINPITPTEPTTISFCHAPSRELASRLSETLIGCDSDGDFLFNEHGLLKILENHDKSIPLRLYPEVGYQGKPKLKQYFKLQSFLHQKGYELEIGWWEQWHQHSIPIEEYPINDIEYITWSEFKHKNRTAKLYYKQSKKYTPDVKFSDRYLDGEAIAKMIAPRSLTGINAPMGSGKTTSIEKILKRHGTRDAFIKALEKKLHGLEIDLKIATSKLNNCTLFKLEQLGELQSNVNRLKDEIADINNQLETEKTLSLITANKGAFLIAHRNSLLLQNKEKLGFLHLRFDDAYNQAYNPKSWLAFCIDSLCKLDYECLTDRIVFLDEISNLIPHLLAGSTCRKFRREILDKFTFLLRHAYAVVIMDANLKDWEFNYIKELGNFSSCNKLANLYQKQPLNITFYEGTIDEKGIIRANDFDTLAQQILIDYGLGETLIIACDGQKKCEYLHEYLGGEKNPEILRIDSSTITEKDVSAFISAPNEELKKKGYKVVIYSPSMDSGISIELINYFTKGYSINTVLGAEAFSQLPGRLRDNIPWVHWSKTFIAKNNELAPTDPTKVEENIRAHAYDDMALAMEKISEGKRLIREGHQLLERSNDIHLATYCKVEAQGNYENKNLRETYYEKLLEDGHNVTKILVPKLGKSAQWQQAKEDVVKRNSENLFGAEDIDLTQAEKIFQELCANIDKQRAAKKAMLTKARLPGLKDTEIWHPALLAFLDYSDQNCISRLELRHLLNNPELELCRQSAWYHNLNLGANNGKIMLQDLRSPQLKARMLRDIGLLDFLSSPDRFYDQDSPEIMALIRRANHWRRQRYLGRRGNIPAMKYVNKILAFVGYKFVAKKHNGKRMYRIVDMYEEVNVAVYDQKLRLTSALTPIIASKYESQLSKAEEYIQQVTQVGTEEPNISIQVCSVPENEAYTKSSVEVQRNKLLDLYQPPPDIYKGNVAKYEDMEFIASAIESAIDYPSYLLKENRKATPLEAFKMQIEDFGWNVIKEAARLSEALASKVIGFVEQLIDSGEWHFAPG
ncbi:MAG: DUF3854 domain-containing protein [Okeania sp. SIO3H1]|nr:DUF3854 domain-containing protein [Okeania sp. SIO3H1]